MIKSPSFYPLPLMEMETLLSFPITSKEKKLSNKASHFFYLSEREIIFRLYTNYEQNSERKQTTYQTIEAHFSTEESFLLKKEEMNDKNAPIQTSFVSKELAQKIHTIVLKKKFLADALKNPSINLKIHTEKMNEIESLKLEAGIDFKKYSLEIERDLA